MDMYGQQMGYNPYGGTTDAYGNIRYSKGQIIQAIRDYVINMTGQYISKEEKLEETPQLLRHACAEAGISQLEMLSFPVPEMGLVVPFYFCSRCGKLFYPKDIY